MFDARSDAIKIQLNPDNSNYQGTEEFVRVIRFSSYRIYR